MCLILETIAAYKNGLTTKISRFTALKIMLTKVLKPNTLCNHSTSLQLKIGVLPLEPTFFLDVALHEVQTKDHLWIQKAVLCSYVKQWRDITVDT